MAYDDSRLYNIEMQAAKYDSYPDRAAFYLSQIFGAQLEKGEPYHLIAPVFGIHFLDYIPTPFLYESIENSQGVKSMLFPLTTS